MGASARILKEAIRGGLHGRGEGRGRRMTEPQRRVTQDLHKVQRLERQTAISPPLLTKT